MNSTIRKNYLIARELKDQKTFETRNNLFKFSLRTKIRKARNDKYV